ncbi:MAG TPA: hypothetical protein PKO09_17885 [Anaerolineae bacterium]|nr:hypothetical protein [Anaerolineae bacterium]
MDKRQKELLRTLLTQLRRTLLGTYGASGEPVRGDLDRELERLGIAPDGTITPLDALSSPTATERRARRAAEAQLAGLPAGERPAARREIVERAGYTWINRLLALRAMETRGLIDCVLRSDPEYVGLSEALYVLRRTQPARAAGADGGWWAVVEDACHSQAASLPGLFDLGDPGAALRPSTQALLTCVTLAGGGLSGFTHEESDEAFRDPDAIGWAYQFYQEEAKARTYAKLGRGGKVETRAEIASVTQLFTEPYMVKWLLQNSLGRTYHELYPGSALPDTWEYYIRPDELQPPHAEGERGPASLEELTFMDPCMGSGHFERECFDMLAAMYHERYPGMPAREIADTVLSRHLHGIDIDPRAVQLAALTLYLRAWELVRDERRAQHLPGAGIYTPPALNLATTPTGLTPGALERHLERHPEDEVFEPLLRGVFGALEQAPILGSLLQPGEHLDEAIRTFQCRAKGQLGLLPEQAALNRLLDELGRHDPAQLRQVLLDRVARSFEAEARDAADVAAALFGREASAGLFLLELLDRTYSVVATNPPYLGSGNATSQLRTFVEHHFPAGKRDLYAAFILRCIALTTPGARVAMVTMLSWMFTKSFNTLRAASEADSLFWPSGRPFRGLLNDTSIEAIAHLGPGAFEEISGEVVQSVMFTLCVSTPSTGHTVTAYRLVHFRGSAHKADALRRSLGRYSQKTQLMTSLPGSPLGYWLSDKLLNVIAGKAVIRLGAHTRAGLTTGEGTKYYRKHWELPDPQTWLPIANGGSYRKWQGHRVEFLRWGTGWQQILSQLGNKLPSREYYAVPGVVLTQSARGCLSCRLWSGGGFTNSSIAAFPVSPAVNLDLAAWLNSRVASYLVRLYSQKMGIEARHLDGLPFLRDAECRELASYCCSVKALLVNADPTERSYSPQPLEHASWIAASLHAAEAVIEERVIGLLGLEETQGEVYRAAGTPAGGYPLIAGYSGFGESAAASMLPPAPPSLTASLRQHSELCLPQADMTHLKTALRTSYDAGPGAAASDSELDEVQQPVDEEAALTGAEIPAPPETFLEQLSQKLQIHPISVYWLLEELRAEGVRCKPEEQRILEDRLSVLVLRLLGHRWPRQIEAGEPVPSWADPDGIIPLTAGTGDPTVADRLRERLRAEDGPLGAQKAEALLAELTGQDLETWLQRPFFPRHVRQFKHRPIAWHLASVPRGRKKASRNPAFECLLYYHACTGDVLARLRTHYLQPLLNAMQGQAQHARRAGDETGAAQAAERAAELEELSSRLRQVEVEAFACPELDAYVEVEPLDRWSGDGVCPPATRAKLLAHERAWHVDVNDGVRVNIAPLQQAGLLASGVLNAKDLPKAIGDRARWRSDERRWVREGILPRCGWMDESVPESPRWTERAPEREAERQRLEEKRRALLARLEGGAPAPAEPEDDGQLPGMLAQ